jgi:hypothetical protein
MPSDRRRRKQMLCFSVWKGRVWKERGDRTDISLSECSIGTTQKLHFEVNTAIELKNVTTTPHNTGTLVSQNTHHQVPLLSHVAVFFYLNRSINPLQVKRSLLNLKTQSVPRSKHFSSRL